MAQVGVRQGPLVFVDIETTGGSHKFARVLEVGVVRVENNRVVATYKTLINPGGPVPAMITRLTGITTHDIEDAPSFQVIADELAEVLEGAVFVAHNVQFDYGFLRMEFERLGASFRPKLLCTVRLSRKLFPEHKGHKLSDLISRHGFAAAARHRAYDDAEVLWQFYQLLLAEFDLDTVDEAIHAQLRSQSLPSNLDKGLVDDLPEAPGIYIFEDEAGAPLYVGKSVNIRQRVMSHFTAFHDNPVERRIAADIRHVRTEVTHGELGALLTESERIKQLQPLHNRRLRKKSRLTLALRHRDADGYARLGLQDADTINPSQAEEIMAVYTTSTRARESLHTLARNFYLCPKLMGLEKSRGACFQVQLRKCRGACGGIETADEYNERFLSAFERQRLHGWPYAGAVLVTEMGAHKPGKEGLLFDQWCLVARVREDADGDVQITRHHDSFDLDQYKILRSYLANERNQRSVQTVSPGNVAALLGEFAAA